MATLPMRMYEQKRRHDAAHDEAARVVTERDRAFGGAASTIPPFTPPPRLADTPVEVPAPAGPDAAATSPAGAASTTPGAAAVPAHASGFGPPSPATGFAFGPGGFGPGGGAGRVAPAPRTPDAYPADARADGVPKRPEYLVESDLPGMYGSEELTSPPVIGEA
jgi:hypothetical protein